MSKKIKIEKNGTVKNFTASKIKTRKQGGGTCSWVPEDEVQVTHKTITAAGTYKASDEGYYGYDEVSVYGMLGERGKVRTKYIKENGLYKAQDEGLAGYSSVNVNVNYKSIVAKERIDPLDPSYDPLDPYGDDILVSTDGEDNIIKTRLADYISIDVPPNKTQYRIREKIDFTGAVVRGYLKDGTPYKDGDYSKSIIPHEKLKIMPSNATDEGATYYSDNGLSRELDYIQQPFSYGVANGNVVTEIRTPCKWYKRGIEWGGESYRIKFNGISNTTKIHYVVFLYKPLLTPQEIIDVYPDYGMFIVVASKDWFRAETETGSTPVGHVENYHGRSFYVCHTNRGYGSYMSSDYDGKAYVVSLASSLNFDENAINGLKHLIEYTYYSDDEVNRVLRVGYDLLFNGYYGNKITVQWAREGDGKILSTNYGIGLIN